MLSETDMRRLRRAVALAEESLEAGDEPFGSVLASVDGTVLFEDRNRVAGGDPTQHPEFAIARWSTTRMSPGERAAATVYTSGEHCPMCSAAHGWAGLGRIVYATSSAQLTSWLKEWGAPPAPVRALPIGEIVPAITVEGPVDSLVARVRALQARFHGRS
ncbi:nucleoside deaminase [Nocardiopsis sp. HUAS JQ3]|uniref:nucleoside deaminase n=1 Tax=Nocardiopsis sp. HUAS JQ3 TaxID=3061629 RepID=UPI0023AA028C|nr:nucleoside deaminase [Nocardiopsis sp. HUAS JQ3]WDZ93215.1 nucleoside deaminase [Nocardiopsis sp. HUAS JQ3]